MSEETALFFIENYPVKGLVTLALSLVNLTKQEETVLNLHCKQNMTQEDIAEELGISRNTVNTRYRKAVKKICIAWDGSYWIEILVEDLKKRMKIL